MVSKDVKINKMFCLALSGAQHIVSKSILQSIHRNEFFD